jgi:hypothetical protein
MKRNENSAKRWRLEVNDPRLTRTWRPLWEFEEEQLANYGELMNDLNRINAPVKLRIVECKLVCFDRSTPVSRLESFPQLE